MKQSIDLGYPFPNTITAMHMLAVCIVTLIFERPSMDEALKVLPISVLNGLSLLTNNSAFLYGGVAFVSMIAANVPFMTFSLELLKGKPLWYEKTSPTCSDVLFFKPSQCTHHLASMCTT